MDPITLPTICVLTHRPFKVKPHWSGTVLEYSTLLTGKVKISQQLLIELQNNKSLRHTDLAGICREALERGEEPPLFTTAYVRDTLKTLQIPRRFNEKVFHLMKLLHNKGGSDHKPLSVSAMHDYTLAFADDEKEFMHIMDYLMNDKYWLKADFHKVTGNYTDVFFTDYGMEEVEKGLPAVPMIGLVSQSITTGDVIADEKINHAKRLFFDEPSTMDNKRSACETLCFVLEPLRDYLKPTFTDADENTFFELVNRFDIRHNKESTKKLMHEEQLEWVFYTLLNTINTYTKMKGKGTR